ncbi:MAG: hypothetical protein K8I00_13040 [Candidatus Omnitrophica bacterium]|nr:hypothetical protein [Candidatus Omnitrophota bacterium]
MKNRTLIALLTVTLCGAYVCTGCQSVRKKFVRQKKKNTEDKFIPILEPVEYAATMVTNADRYRHHYQTYRIWERELLAGLDRQESDKRLQYSLGQLIVNLETMAQWTPDNKKARLQEVLGSYRTAGDYFETSEALRNRTSFISKLKRFERSMRSELQPDMVFPRE